MMLCMRHQTGTVKCIQCCYDALYMPPGRNSEMYSVLLWCWVCVTRQEQWNVFSVVTMPCAWRRQRRTIRRRWSGQRRRSRSWQRNWKTWYSRKALCPQRSAVFALCQLGNLGLLLGHAFLLCFTFFFSDQPHVLHIWQIYVVDELTLFPHWFGLNFGLHNYGNSLPDSMKIYKPRLNMIDPVPRTTTCENNIKWAKQWFFTQPLFISQSCWSTALLPQKKKNWHNCLCFVPFWQCPCIWIL